LGIWKLIVTRTPFLVFLVIVLAIGITSAYSLINITFAGDVIVTGNLDSGGTVTSPTITSLQSQITSIDGRVTTLEGP